MAEFSIAVVGAQGQVGTELCREAEKMAITVHALGRHDLDITNPVAVNDCVARLSPTVVINAAAYTAVDKAEQESELAFAVNETGADNLARACQQENIPLLHISTDYVFDGAKPGPYCESDPASPLGAYGQSKWQGEEKIRAALTAHIILRVAWVFGAHGHNFVKTILRLSQSHEQLRIVDDQKGGPTSAQSIAKTLLQLATQYREHGSLKWGTYHYCGQPATTWCGFAKQIVSQAGELNMLEKAITVLPITTDEYPTPAKRPMNSVLDSTMLTANFAITPPDWRQDLQQVLNELNTNK